RRNAGRRAPRRAGRPLRRQTRGFQGTQIYRIPPHRFPSDAINANPEGNVEKGKGEPYRGSLGPGSESASPPLKEMSEMTMNALSQPETCDILIRNGYVLTLDRERRVFPSGAVAISGNAIA